MSNKAVFLDRDGVINRKAPDNAYITHWANMRFLPGVAICLRRLNQAGFRVFVVTNQRCVAKGLLTSQQLESIHRRMCDSLSAAGGRIEAVYYCPHETQPPCNCRKPAPGLLLTAAREHRLDLASSWMVGDSELDVEAGKNAGCKTVRVLEHKQTDNGCADVVAHSLIDATYQILQMERSVGLQMERSSASVIARN